MTKGFHVKGKTYCLTDVEVQSQLLPLLDSEIRKLNISDRCCSKPAFRALYHAKGLLPFSRKRESIQDSTVLKGTIPSLFERTFPSLYSYCTTSCSLHVEHLAGNKINTAPGAKFSTDHLSRAMQVEKHMPYARNVISCLQPVSLATFHGATNTCSRK
ncbi:LAFA_0C08350g1_1 [Lachancea sp. 'fantastica']|nr:LAFA_0C08350g1_1 [Lachancea sp. 'fantastica']